MYVTVSRDVEWTNEHNNNFTKWQRSLQTQTTKTTFLRRLKQHFPGCLRGQQIHAIYTCLSTRSHVILILICFYRATLCITRTVLSQHVWLSSFTRRYCVKTVKDILKLFLQSDSHTSIVFPYQTSCQYSDGDFLTGESNAGVWKNRDFRPISHFMPETIQGRATVQGRRSHMSWGVMTPPHFSRQRGTGGHNLGIIH